MKRLFFLFILLLLTSLHLVHQAVGNVKAQDPSLYLDPKTGEERLVDTTIVRGSQIGYPFENMTNNFSSSFSDVLKEKEMIRVGKLEETFTFGIPFKQSFGTLSPEGKATTKGNTITYPKVWGGSDLRYTVSPERLLEEIIVPTREEAGKITEFTQTLSLGKLTARKNDDGSITILKDNQGVVFTIPKPLLYELNNKKVTHDGVVYELTSEIGGTKLTKRVTEEGRRWLTDKRRHYPVVIDAAVTVATSTSANAMGTSFQSKVFFNPGTSNYWSFYYNGSAIAYSSSTDGVTWVARGTLSYNTFHFSISQRDQSNTIFLATQCGSDLDICVKKGTISGTSISWGSEYTALDGTDATTDAYTRPNIALSRMGNIWVAARKQTAASTFTSTVRKSSSVEDPSSWAAASSVGTSQTYLLDHVLVPTTYNNMYLVVNGSGGDKSVTGYTYNGTSWAAAVTGGDAGAPAWSAVSGTIQLGMDSYVYAFAVSGSNLYAGGAFTTASGMTVNYIAKWDGTSWSALGGGMSTEVRVLAISGTDLYAGGNFTAAGGVTVNRIAKWNGTSWSALGGGMNSNVNSLAVSGTNLYAGGDFTTADGVTVNYIAKWNGTSWSALAGGMNNVVPALAVSGTDLYAGGSFATAGGVTVNYIAKWNGTSWSALGTGMNTAVNVILISGSDLYAGGDFTTAGGVTVNRIAKWNGTSWSALGTGMNNTVRALSISGTDLYAGGAFDTAGGVTVKYVAKWNGTSWSGLGGGMSDFGYIRSLTFYGTDLYAGGNFTTAGGVPVNDIAKWNGTSWSTLGPAGINSSINFLLISGTDLYAAGPFSVIGGVTVNYIAKWNGTSWSALGTGMIGGVNSLIVIGTDLYAGGGFTTAGGVTVNYVAKWNGTSWSALGGGMNAAVYTVLVSGTDLYAGGGFTTAGGVTVNGIAKWNGTSWSALGTGMNLYGNPVAMDISGTNLYVGGYFNTAGGVTVNKIAKWNGTSWSALGTGMNNIVNAVVVSGNDLYAGGYFTTAGGVTVNYIAKWNGTSWSALGGGVNSTINALAISGTDLYAGGGFTTAGGVTVNKIAKWNGTSWSALGGGVSGQVNAIALSGGDLYTAGNIGVINDTQYGNIGKLGASAGSISSSASTAQEIATVSDFSDVTHLLYVDGSADVQYKKFSGGSWGTKVTLLTGTATNPSIAINKANGDLYAFWMEGSTIKYKKGVAPYASGNWDASPTSYYASGTNATISAGSRWDGVFLQWVNGTGNPYGITFDKLSAQSTTCYPPPGGAFYVETNCAVTGTVGGADDGDLLITSGQTYTINAGQSTVWGPGKSVTIPTGGSIVISNTGTLKQTNMWMVDNDGDGYPASTTITAQTNTPGGTYVRRKNLQTYTATDSNDSDASVH